MFSPDRRGLLGSMAGAAGGLLAGAAVAPPATPSHDFTRPADNLDALLRMISSADSANTYWYYTGVILGVRPDAAPVPLLAFEGTEVNWADRVDADTWLVRNGTFSQFRDLETGVVLDQWTNPLNGARVKVAPNILLGLGGEIISTRGAWFKFGPTEPAPKPLRPLWSIAGGQAWCIKPRTYPSGLPQPLMELPTLRTSLAALADRARPSLPADMSSAYIGRYSPFMAMGNQPGHVVWQASGFKLSSPAYYPAGFRTALERLAPRVLAGREGWKPAPKDQSTS